jgi:C-terminal processing protease CtpA/Prc
MRMIHPTRLAAAFLALVLVPSISRPATAQDTSKKAAEEALRDAVKEMADKQIHGRLVSIPDLPPNDPHHSVMLKLKATMNKSCADCHSSGLAFHADDLFGLTVTPADPAIRDQLKLENRGLVVTAVTSQSAAEAAGIKDKDILIDWLIGWESRPLTTADDLKAAFKGFVDHRVVLKLLRAGEPREITIKDDAHRPQPESLKLAVKLLGQTTAPSYWVGLSVNPADETLRSHLKLKDGTGLVVAEVIKDTPAEKAGLKVNDVLLAIDGHPAKETNDLVQAVQKAKESPIKIRLKRRGDEQVIGVTPVPRKEKDLINLAAGTFEQPSLDTNLQVFHLALPGRPIVQDYYNVVAGQQVPMTYQQGIAFIAQPEHKAAVDRLDAEIKDLSAQLKELKEAIKTLNATMKERKAPDR